MPILLELKVPGQRLIIQPSENLFILYDNFTFFLKGVRQFIQKLQHIPEDTDPITDSIKPFEFVPLELDFKFALLDGEVSSEEEGEITVQIMANLEMINSSLSSEYIGATINVEVKDMLGFLNNLEVEVLRCIGE